TQSCIEDVPPHRRWGGDPSGGWGRGDWLGAFYPSTIRSAADGSPPHELRSQGGTYSSVLSPSAAASPPSPSASSPSTVGTSPAAASSSSSAFIADGETIVATVKSSSSFHGTTPSGSLTSLMWIESPISRPVRSI